jgi:hypothetical protein
MPTTPTVLDQVRALGLNPAGYRDPDSGQLVPWDAAADRIADLDADGYPDDGPLYTVFEYLTDQAGAHNMALDEWLQETGPDEGEDEL